MQWNQQMGTASVNEWMDQCLYQISAWRRSKQRNERSACNLCSLLSRPLSEILTRTGTTALLWSFIFSMLRTIYFASTTCRKLKLTIRCFPTTETHEHIQIQTDSLKRQSGLIFLQKQICWTNVAVWWLARLHRIRDVPNSDLGCDIGSLDCLAWFPSVPPRNCRDSTLQSIHYQTSFESIRPMQLRKRR
jgi:hypothetical protein